MKTYNQPTTEIVRVENYLCQNAASPSPAPGFSPLSPGDQTQTNGQYEAM